MAKKTTSAAEAETRDIRFTWKRKKYTASVTETMLNGQRAVAAVVNMGKGETELFHFLWVSEEDLFWNDIPIEWKQEMAWAIAKELVK